jgi:hypothetical protein
MMKRAKGEGKTWIKKKHEKGDEMMKRAKGETWKGRFG